MAWFDEVGDLREISLHFRFFVLFDEVIDFCEIFSILLKRLCVCRFSDLVGSLATLIPSCSE